MLTRSELGRVVEANWDRQLQWLQSLTSFPSERGQEAACQDWIARSFSDRGWVVDRYALSDVSMEHLPGYSPAVDVDYENAIQVIGALRAPNPCGKSLILQGHVDVVPPGPSDMWTDGPYAALVRDGKLFARGACDMKAGVCAMVFALDALREAGFLPGSDVFVQTVTEEESTGNGALSTLARGYRADACLIPEPTQQNILRASLGVMWFRLSVRGTPAHVAESEQGTSAILSTFHLINALEEFTLQLNERVQRHPWFSKLSSPIKFNPGKIRGGDWASSTPAWCELDCRIAVLPGLSLDAFRQEITEVVNKAAANDPFLANTPPQIIWNGFQAEDYVLEPGTDFETAMRNAHAAVTGQPAKEILFTGVTDCRFYGRYYGIPALCYGAKGSQIHGFDEHVDLDSVRQTTMVIADFVQRWCGLRRI
ncbi:Acetylornitine deacetylase (YodQ protein) (plasmid) [Neorhizobium galegae bv. officinalis bv. officinalis str. HAMBI 1141]|uniref:Acetylornitine deacetylase (YodQ protein) n=1 Tax=Neorhizobium galegae bv. officinalis bv. officinalis str. HAMBI 1141 TaxID=1028801 RepID=A0A068THT0_NEOGA|nr:ArgE/DapE family deacylase [Neorhizobium galegae]CDN57636.1 Acetylornitine deacetylase (YodQ protein) [Neorhizobium galegae bv. officinalis bv. officinalis str. HAMBI 1141]